MRSKLNKITGTLALLTAVLLLGTTQLVRAEDGAAPGVWLRVSPTTSNINLDPGQDFSGVIKVDNTGAEPVDFRVYASPYGLRDLTYEPFYGSSTIYNQIVEWISFDQTEYQSLAPGQSLDVRYHVKVPANAPGGSQHAVIFAETIAKELPESASGGVLNTVSRVGSLLSATISGETRGQGNLESVHQPTFLTDSPINSQLVFKNTGNVDLDVHYSHFVSGIFGRLVCSTTEDHRVAAETSRQVSLACDNNPIFGLFRVTNAATFTGFMGSVKYDQSDLVLIAPWWLLLIIFILLAVVAFVAARLIIQRVKLKKRKVV